MKILIVTPPVPYPTHGADALDRFYGMKLFQELGAEIAIVAKMETYRDPKAPQKLSQLLNGAPVSTVPYTRGGLKWGRLRDPRWLDGAAFEYTDAATVSMVRSVATSFKPDCMWIDHSALWPMIRVAHQLNLSAIIRSHNIESRHLLSDEGISPVRLLSAFGKELGERTLARIADAVCAITPNETQFYSRAGAKRAVTIPLRALPYILEEGSFEYRESSPLHVVFTGAGYTVGHNLRAAKFIIQNIAPRMLLRNPSGYVFHITGAKLPKSIADRLPENVQYEGFVDDYQAFINTMDIALAPSLGGAGMQQKIFEPITRGIPTITSPRGIAGYDLRDKEHVLLASSAEEVVDALEHLQERKERSRLGEAARSQAEILFSKNHVMQTLQEAINNVLK